MRNLSATGMVPSPIDADRDASAYATNFQAIGLPDQSPFDILSRPRAVPNAAAKPARKRGPKPSLAQRIIASLSDRKTGRSFNTDIMSKAESDRTNAIAGRGFA